MEPQEWGISTGDKPGVTFAQAGQPRSWCQHTSTSFPEILVCCGWFTTAEVPTQQEALAKSGLPNRPTKSASAALCRIVISFSTARFVTQGSDPVKPERLFCMLPYVIIFCKKESKCQAKGRRKTNTNHLNRE